MTYIYLAYIGTQRIGTTLNSSDPRVHRVNLLMSMAYLDNVRRDAIPLRAKFGRAMLDSGAFTVYKQGGTVDIDEVIAESKKPIWTESVALDVIGDANASLKNALYMKRNGSPAFPVFHLGDPWEHLAEYAKQFDKVGLSCSFNPDATENLRWLDQCFARVWPKKFHCFGRTGKKYVERYPFDSADSSTWELQSFGYGSWSGYTKSPTPLPTDSTDPSVCVFNYVKQEIRLEQLWRKELAQIRTPPVAPRRAKR